MRQILLIIGFVLLTLTSFAQDLSLDAYCVKYWDETDEFDSLGVLNVDIVDGAHITLFLNEVFSLDYEADDIIINQKGNFISRTFVARDSDDNIIHSLMIITRTSGLLVSIDFATKSDDQEFSLMAYRINK